MRHALYNGENVRGAFRRHEGSAVSEADLAFMLPAVDMPCNLRRTPSPIIIPSTSTYYCRTLYQRTNIAGKQEISIKNVPSPFQQHDFQHQAIPPDPFELHRNLAITLGLCVCFFALGSI